MVLDSKSESEDSRSFDQGLELMSLAMALAFFFLGLSLTLWWFGSLLLLLSLFSLWVLVF